MRYFANPCGPNVRAAMEAGLLGFIATPNQGNSRPPGVEWVADNGAFSASFHEAKWLRFLERNAHDAATCRFAVLPDVVGDAQATQARSWPWIDYVKALGYPVAYVSQDGALTHPPPWPLIDALFIGGTDTHKLGPEGREMAAEARARGKWLHMGRVNSQKRFTFARHLRCHSVDGTFLTHGPNRRLPELLGWIRSLEDQELPI